jgi:ketosteroid isomerase-like protein
MEIRSFIKNWIETGNRYDTDRYLTFYLPDAVLEDPSVGNTFIGHDGIRRYFTDYFIGYQTHTKIVKLDIQDNEHAYLEVAFTGNFPEGHIGGTFDLRFNDGKIAFVKADLL